MSDARTPLLDGNPFADGAEEAGGYASPERSRNSLSASVSDHVASSASGGGRFSGPLFYACPFILANEFCERLAYYGEPPPEARQGSPPRRASAGCARADSRHPSPFRRVGATRSRAPAQPQRSDAARRPLRARRLLIPPCGLSRAFYSRRGVSASRESLLTAWPPQATNLVTYLGQDQKHGVLQLSKNQASAMQQMWSGTCYLTAIIGAVVADAKLGRCAARRAGGCPPPRMPPPT